jgi:hypothetical protein
MNTQHHTRTDRHPLRDGFEGLRWWCTPATAAAAASAALVAILATAAPGSAVPTETDRYATTSLARATWGITHTAAHAARVPVAEPPDLPDGWRQCFMWQSHWNTALDGPQPLCPEDPTR